MRSFNLAGGIGKGYHMKQLIQNRMALAGMVFILIILAFAVFAPFIATHDPAKIDSGSVLMGPSRAHIFGTDALGRDIFSRIVYGSRISLSIGFIAVGIAVFLVTSYLFGVKEMKDLLVWISKRK